MNVPQANFKVGRGLTEEFVNDRATRFHNNLNVPKDVLSHGLSVNYRNLGQITRAKIEHEVKNAGLRPESLDYVILPSSTKDDAIHSYFNNTPVVYDALNPTEVAESSQQVKEWYTKSLGASELYMPSIDMEKDAITGDALGDVFGKALTSNITALHAVADDSIAILNMDTQIVQNIFATEANMGKDVYFDITGPYTGNAAAYFGTELQDLVDSDFDMYTRKDQLYFMFCNGMVSDAAVKFGMSAYPKREFMSLSTLMHQLGARKLRERRLLGVNSDVRSPVVSWEDHTPGLNYAGLHEMAMNSYNNANHELKSVISGANVYTGSETAQQVYQNIDNLINTVGVKMQIAGQDPNIILTDFGTATAIRNGMMQYARIVPPTPASAFGISSIQLNILGFKPIEVIAHPWLPRTSGQSALFMFDSKMFSRRIGWLDTLELLGKYNNLSQRFAISSAETFIDKSDINGTSSLMGGIVGITHPDYGF